MEKHVEILVACNAGLKPFVDNSKISIFLSYFDILKLKIKTVPTSGRKKRLLLQ